MLSFCNDSTDCRMAEIQGSSVRRSQSEDMHIHSDNNKDTVGSISGVYVTVSIDGRVIRRLLLASQSLLGSFLQIAMMLLSGLVTVGKLGQSDSFCTSLRPSNTGTK